MNSCNKCESSTKCKYNGFEETCQNCLFDMAYVDITKLDPCNSCTDGSNFVYYAIGNPQ